MRRNKDEALQIYIIHTVNKYRLSKAAAEALFYDEKGGKLPIGLSVTRAKTYRKFTVIFQSSDEQHSKKAECEIPAVCLNNIHNRKFELELTQESDPYVWRDNLIRNTQHRKFELELTQESDPYVWRDNLIRNTQPTIYKYISSFFSSRQQGESFDDSYSAADNGLQGLELTSF